MEISLKTTHYTKIISVKADNVNIEEDITQFLWGTKEDGKTDFSKRLGEDITDDSLNQIVRLLSDMIYYRDRKFDSSDLIESLFDKLPSDKTEELLKKLNEQYEIESE